MNHVLGMPDEEHFKVMLEGYFDVLRDYSRDPERGHLISGLQKFPWCTYLKRIQIRADSFEPLQGIHEQRRAVQDFIRPIYGPLFSLATSIFGDVAGISLEPWAPKLVEEECSDDCRCWNPFGRESYRNGSDGRQQLAVDLLRTGEDVGYTCADAKVQPQFIIAWSRGNGSTIDHVPHIFYQKGGGPWHTSDKAKGMLHFRSAVAKMRERWPEMKSVYSMSSGLGTSSQSLHNTATGERHWCSSLSFRLGLGFDGPTRVERGGGTSKAWLDLEFGIVPFHACGSDRRRTDIAGNVAASDDSVDEEDAPSADTSDEEEEDAIHDDDVEVSDEEGAGESSEEASS